MHCRTAQRQMALAVGEDLPQAESVELNVHLAECATCQQAWSQHQQCFTALQSSRVESIVAPRTTVWPVVARRIQRRALTPRRVELNGWIASLVVASASVLVFVFSQEEQSLQKVSGEHRIAIGGIPVVLIPDASAEVQGLPFHADSTISRSSRPTSFAHWGDL